MIDPLLPELGTAYYVCEWLVRLVMLAVVPLRRTAAAARSWLLLIFFLPIPGLLLYLAIGRPRFPRWRADRFKQLAPFFARLAGQLAGAAPPSLAPDDESVAALAHRLGRLPAVGGNSAELLPDYDVTIDRLIADIDAARQHVRLLVYIFASDATGRKVADALARAVKRGIACHVLIDPVGSHYWARTVLAMLRDAGVDARATLPIRFLRGRTRRDMRNHRKLFLIDGVIGYAGSQNIVDKDFGAGVENRELAVRVTGPVVAEMTAVFLADWYLETEVMLPEPALPESTGDVTAQLLPSGADYPVAGFESLLVWQIHQARERVIIVTPYLVPDDDVLAAMRSAVLRGVAIHLVVSAIVDQPLVHLAQSSYYHELLARGVRIHRYRHYLLHAKTISIDGRLGIVGSSNVDIRSFQLNQEAVLLLFGVSAVAALEAVQHGYLDASDEMDLAIWRKRPRWRKIGENAARLVGPLL